MDLSKVKITKLTLALSLSFTVSACGFQKYLAKPIQPNEGIQRFEARSLDDPAFNEYLLAQNYPQSQLPIQEWGLKELTYSALFFHPDLDVARAMWRAQQASVITASQNPEIGLNGSTDHHSQHKSKSPWTYTLGIDVPIVTAGKRQAAIDQATNLSEAARIEIAQTAWQVRNRLTQSLIEYQYAIQQTAILEQEVSLRKLIVDMLQKRLDAGMASSIELSNARIALQKSEQMLNEQSGKISSLEASLASSAGLPLGSLKKLKITNHFSNQQKIQADLLQYEALNNRLDIRAALAQFDAAEAKLRLEIARQYPDFSLSPSKGLDQGDQILTLGFTSLLTLINKNRGPIAQASAMRELEFTKFEALQAKVIGELNQTKANYYSALALEEKANIVLISQQKRTDRTQVQFDAGFADRLELTNTHLENLIAKQNLLATAYKLKAAEINLENAMQKPLADFNMPTNLENRPK